MKTKHIAQIICVSILLMRCTPTPDREAIDDLFAFVDRSEIVTEKVLGTQEEKLVVVQKPYIAYHEVIERSPNVQSVTRITNFKGSKEPSYFTLSKDDTEIIFQALETINDDKLSNLWKTSSYGLFGLTRLTAGIYFDVEPCISPDGYELYFSSNRSSGTPKIYRTNLLSPSGITRITSAQMEDRFPSVDMKSGRIYFNSRPGSAYEWQIWYTNEDGSFPTQLKEGQWPSISPQGNKILYCAKDYGTGKMKIWTMNIDGTNQTQLTTDKNSNEKYPSWSPNGNMIIYSSDIGVDSHGRSNYDIWIMAFDGSRKTQLTTNGSTDFIPKMSSDRQYIYFLSNRGLSWDIWRIQIGRKQ
jgi:dipeptidyl aminopeptidase/acylaminoacyl peptidase